MCLKYVESTDLIWTRVNKQIVGIVTFMIRKKSILGLSELEKLNFLILLYLRPFKISCSADLSMKNKYYLGARLRGRIN